MTRLLALTTAFAALVACGSTTAATRLASCTGSQLAGTFTVVPGSGAAGSIGYVLRLKNVSASTCMLTGLPQGSLLSKSGKALPTHITPEFPGAMTAILVRLAPGAWTHAGARFSPDVPGVGEPTSGTKCEPVAYWLRVNGQGGGATKVKISPPTSVCEHGAMKFSAYGIGR